MTDPSTSNEEAALILGAKLERNQGYRPWWASMGKPVDWLLGFVPTHRDTRKGRNGARQVKVVMLVLGVLIIAFGESLLWVAIGLTIMIFSLVLPMAELRKRSFTSRIRAFQGERTRRVLVAGKIVHDGRRVELHDGETMLRRVLLNKPYGLEERVSRGRPCLGLVPSGKRKRDSIWVCAEAGMPEFDFDEDRALGKDEADVLALVDVESFRRLHDALE